MRSCGVSILEATKFISASKMRPKGMLGSASFGKKFTIIVQRVWSTSNVADGVTASLPPQTVSLCTGNSGFTAKKLVVIGRKAARKLLCLCVGLAPAKWIAGVKSGRVVYPLGGAPQKLVWPDHSPIDEWLASGLISKYENPSDRSHFGRFVPGGRFVRHGPVGRAFHD